MFRYGGVVAAGVLPLGSFAGVLGAVSLLASDFVSGFVFVSVGAAPEPLPSNELPSGEVLFSDGGALLA